MKAVAVSVKRPPVSPTAMASALTIPTFYVDVFRQLQIESTVARRLADGIDRIGLPPIVELARSENDASNVPVGGEGAEKRRSA